MFLAVLISVLFSAIRHSRAVEALHPQPCIDNHRRGPQGQSCHSHVCLPERRECVCRSRLFVSCFFFFFFLHLGYLCTFFSDTQVPEAKSLSRTTFVHVPTEIGAEEAEEVGVEHLLRSITDATSSSVAGKVQAKLASLKGLENRMNTMKVFLPPYLFPAFILHVFP